MNGIFVPLTISLITFFVLGMEAASSSSLLPSINFQTAFAQTDTPMSEDGSNNNNNNNNLNNNSIAYSYNFYENNNNTQEAPIRLHNSSVNYYDNNTGYLVYPELANNTQEQQQQQLPAVIMIHEWFGLNEHIKNQADIL